MSRAESKNWSKNWSKNFLDFFLEKNPEKYFSKLCFPESIQEYSNIFLSIPGNLWLGENNLQIPFWKFAKFQKKKEKFPKKIRTISEKLKNTPKSLPKSPPQKPFRSDYWKNRRRSSPAHITFHQQLPQVPTFSNWLGTPMFIISRTWLFWLSNRSPFWLSNLNPSTVRGNFPEKSSEKFLLKFLLFFWNSCSNSC